ncbi:MAG: TIM barrel protein [Chloroflexota bacterium]|nr:TIM barrel protein [Chloroflexota bacterium]
MLKGLSFAPSDQYLRLLDEEAYGLGSLRKLGVTHLELRTREPSIADEMELARLCQQSGYGIALHPIWGGPFDLLGFDSDTESPIRHNLEMLLAAAGELASHQERPVVIVVHGPSFPGDDGHGRALGVAVVARFLHWAGEYVERQGWRVILGFENRPRVAGRAIVGDSHAETLKVVQEVGHGLVRITWDMGHSAVNALAGDDDLWPSEGFLERVCHVHVHDVKDGTDHYPLIYNGVPYSAYISRLAGLGYEGILAIELGDIVTRLGLDGRGAWEAIRSSIINLGKAL